MLHQEVQISAAFKQQTTKAIAAIIFFSIAYLLLLAVGFSFCATCVYWGGMLILLRPSFLTLVIGLGLISVGCLIFLFLIKFFFKSHQVDRSHLREIKRNEHPKLFQLIEEIVQEVGTTFPKKVYLSANVNASVFYNSSFWSMFLPIRKNLQIGLGLVNAVTEEELKAILAHEFGHFSQKTMKVGSYVYHVNQIIFNMLYDNEGYERLVQSWMSISDYLNVFVAIAIKIIQGIQWILGQLYGVVNKSYLGLSREMEFHADEIAASVTGHEPLKNALLRLSLADHAFSESIKFYEEKIKEQLKSKNLYQEQSYLMDFVAADNDIAIENNLPAVTIEQLTKFDKSKLVIENQWASHPSTEDRVARLEQTGLHAEDQAEHSANLVFNQLEQLQEEMTNHVFEGAFEQGPTQELDVQAFEQAYQTEYQKNTFSKVFNGYYDNKDPFDFDWNQSVEIGANTTLEDLFSNQQVDLVYTTLSLQRDIAVLQQVADKSIAIKTFDYDGKKYKRKESKALLKQLEQEVETINAHVQANDIRIFKFFKQQEALAGRVPQLEQLYQDFFEFIDSLDEKGEQYQNLMERLQFVEEVTSYDQIARNFAEVASLEKLVKTNIQTLLNDEVYQVYITEEIRTQLEWYCSKTWRYFEGEQYIEEHLQGLFASLNYYAYLMSQGSFVLKKKLLNYQAELAETIDENS